jgi:hypothetical protein
MTKRTEEAFTHGYRVLLETGQWRAVANGVEVTVVEGCLTVLSEHGALIVSYAPGQWKQVERLDL